MGTVTEKLMTYGVGRTLTYSDMPAVRGAVREVEAKDDRFSALVLAVVKSPQFQMRQKGGAGAGPKTIATDGVAAPQPAKYGFNDSRIFHRQEVAR